MLISELPDEPSFVDDFEGVYVSKVLVKTTCDVYWLFNNQWVQVLMLYPYFAGEEYYRAVGFDGANIATYVVSKQWNCRVLSPHN